MADMSRDEILALAVRLDKANEKHKDQAGDYLYRGPGDPLLEEAARSLRLLAGEGEPMAVKALAWIAGDNIERDRESWIAHDGFGSSYFVIERQWSHPSIGYGGLVESNDAAKAAAQADYEARVRSALVTPPARSYAEGVEDDVKAMSEAENAICDAFDHGAAGEKALKALRNAGFEVRSALAPKEG